MGAYQFITKAKGSFALVKKYDALVKKYDALVKIQGGHFWGITRAKSRQ